MANVQEVHKRVTVILLVASYLSLASCTSLSGRTPLSSRNMTVYVQEACEFRPISGATIESYDASTGTRQVLGKTDDLGAASITFDAETELLLVCKKHYHCVALFPQLVKGVEETDVSLPRWSIR